MAHPQALRFEVAAAFPYHFAARPHMWHDYLALEAACLLYLTLSAACTTARSLLHLAGSGR